MAVDFTPTAYLRGGTTPVTAVPLTISAFFKPDVSGSTSSLVSIVDASSSLEYMRLDAGSSNRLFAWSNSAAEGNDIAIASNNTTNGVWHHGAAIFESTTSRTAILDGDLANQGTNTATNTPLNLDRVTIGVADDATPGSGFNGKIAEVGVWNVALSDPEVLSLAAGVSPRFIRPQNLVVYVPLIRDQYNDLTGNVSFTSSGTLAVHPHPAIIYPAPATLPFIPASSDSTAPLLSLPTSTAVTQTTATVGCTTDEANGTLYMVATAADSAPSAAQVKAGQNSGGTSAIASTSQAISTSGAKTFDIGSTLVPGTTYYLWYMHEDAATNQSTVLDGNSITMLSAFSTTATYAGGTIGSGSIGHYAAGTSDSGSATQMVDSGLVSTDDEFNGLTLHNDTDTTSVVINDSTASSDTLDFTTGSVDFTSNDDYRITATIDSSDVWYCEGTATVSSGSVDIDWYIYDDSASTYTEIYTQTINGLSEADGDYTTSIDANGVLTLTAVVVGASDGAITRSPISNVLQDVLHSTVR